MSFQDKIDIEIQKQKEQNKYKQQSIDNLIKSYLDKIEKETIQQRLARMIARNQNEATLICDDSLRHSEFNRNKLVTTPLCELSSSYDTQNSIIDLIKIRLPEGYNVYYHYNTDDGNNGNGGIITRIINYEITIYKASSLFDYICVQPWCHVLCCYWDCSFRFTDQFDSDVVI
jgi:hypothetical protein